MAYVLPISSSPLNSSLEDDVYHTPSPAFPLVNNQNNQPRNLKPQAAGHGAYSASPSQLSLSSDPQLNPYQQPPTYPFAPHDPSVYGFQQPPPAYRAPPLQTQLPQPPHPGQHPGPPSSSSNQGSPSLPRKRRSSDINVDPHSTSTGGVGGGGGGSQQHPGSSNAFLPPMDTSGTGGPHTGGPHDTTGLPTHPHQQAGQPPQPGGPGVPPSSTTAGGASQGAGGQGMPSPAAKKGRTNTPWTPAEEQRLKTLRDAGSSWSDIAKMFPTRTEGSVKKHWYKDMHYAEFAADESAALLQAMKEYENNKWKAIGQKLGKPAKACEQFAKDQGWKV